MDMFFYVDLCSLVILLSLLISLFIPNKMKGNSNKLYALVLLFSNVDVFFRLLFKMLCTYAPKNNVIFILLYVIKYLELFGYLFILPFSLLYILSILTLYYRFNNHTVWAFIIFFFLASPAFLLICNIFKPWLFYITHNYEYCVSNGFPELKINSFIIAMLCYLLYTTLRRSENFLNPVINARSYYSFLAEVRKYYSQKRSSSIIFVKIINHKNIQMYIGHDTYMKFLRYLSSFLEVVSNENRMDINVYYLGGCAFALPTESKNIPVVQKVADEITERLKNEIKFDGYDIVMEPRVCLVRVPTDIDNYEYLKYFSKAFHYMLPENSNVIWLGDINKTREFKIKNELETIIDFAIANDLFQIFYQPIYDVIEKRYVSAEALVRLEDENYGFINPEVFIPVAEANGSIHKIGDLVIDKVCKFIGEGAFNLLGLDYIEINISISQCTETYFVEKLQESLRKYNVSPECIRLEITENKTGYNKKLVEKNIKQLHSSGIKFVLDDYGIGYSSFTDLLNLPFDVIKLDKTLVNEIDNPKMRVVIQETIKMMLQLKKEVFVEGIEKEENIKLFSDFGCKSIQGYYLSKPIPEADFVEFMRKNR